MYQFVTFATHTSSRGTKNTLDLILSSNRELSSNVVEEPPLFNSDHSSISFKINLCFNKAKSKLQKRLNYRKANYDAISVFISSLNWDRQFSHFSTLQAKYDHFVSILRETVESYCPFQKHCKRILPGQLVKMLRKRKSLKMLHKHSQLARVQYKALQVKLKRANNKFRINVEQKILKTGSPKAIAAYIRNRLKVSYDIPTLKCDVTNDVAFQDCEKSEMLANNFQNNFGIGSQNHWLPPIFPARKATVISPGFSPESVYDYLLKLPNKFSFSFEGINQYILKNCAVAVAHPLSLIFQETLNTAVIPNQWKRSAIVPVFKKGNRGNPKNYRPISLTSPIHPLYVGYLKKCSLTQLLKVVHPE
jgi:hypothetical protein